MAYRPDKLSTEHKAGWQGIGRAGWRDPGGSVCLVERVARRCVAAFLADGCAYPQPPVDELCTSYEEEKFTGKQLIHIIHSPLWMTCA
jgi:hypothetical protein